MTQSLFIFVLPTENNEIIKCYFHDLKGILNDDSFNKYINPVFFIHLKYMLFISI